MHFSKTEDLMNKKILWISTAWLTAGFYACERASESYPEARTTVSAVYATFSDGSGFFNPETPTPYTGDTLKIVVPSHYPEESDHVSDITKMRLQVNPPASISGADGIMDLSRPVAITLRSEDGSEKKLFVVAKVRRSSEALIRSFELPGVNQVGYLVESRRVIGLVSGGISLAGQKPRLTLSPHATISPDTSLAQDFSGPVVYTVTAEDGTKVQYTVKPVTPQKIAAGLRKESARLLWTRKLAELGINDTDHLTTSLAISGKHLLVNTRNAANKYLDRFTGDFSGTQVMGEIQTREFMNFFATSDEAGQILISNLITAAGQTLYVYKWKNAADAAPVKFIEWKSDITGGQAGRKFSIRGDLSRDALIFMGASNANNTILRWQVKDGVLLSQTPVKITYPGTNKWTLSADAISEGTNVTDNLFVSGYPGDFVYMRSSDGAVLGQVNLAASGYTANHSLDLAGFNKAGYLAAVSIANLNGNAFLYDVTDPTALSTAPGSAGYAGVMVYKSPLISSAANGNLTGDVLLKVSEDGYKMVMYVLVTNGSVAAYEFDCVDIGSIQ